MPLDSASLREFAARYTAAWCSHDPAAVASFFSPAGSLTVNDGALAVGREAIAAVAQSFFTTFPDLQVVLDDVLVQGDRAEFHWTLIGTNSGPGGAGHRVRISGVERWLLGDDALIASSQGHFDTADYARQLQHGAPEPS
ncbi:MAG TPA: SgcJ/EcaC family oxidoreductase [Candidatus Acidoferrum sp.]|jgi:uncharacterized protein (TIGR02246 family)